MNDQHQQAHAQRLLEHASEDDDMSLSNDFFAALTPEDMDDLRALDEFQLEMIFGPGDNNTNNNQNNIAVDSEDDNRDEDDSSPLNDLFASFLSEDIDDLPAQEEFQLEMIFGRPGDNNNNNNNQNNIEVFREAGPNRFKSSRSLPIHRSSSSSPKDWIHGSQYINQKQLGSTQWNLRHAIHLHSFERTQLELFLLKRIRACIGWAVHGLIFDFWDGTRAGYVSEVVSILDDDAISRRRPTDWVYIDRGDYVRQVHGFNLTREHFLCHTIHFEMASGRRISFESQHEPWKGTPFEYELPETALLHYVSFREGRCIGLTAVDTIMHLPIQSIQRVMMLPIACQDYYFFLQLVTTRVDKQLSSKGNGNIGRDLWRIIIFEYLVCHDLFHDQTSSREFRRRNRLMT